MFYFDNAASTQPYKETVDFLSEVFLNSYANPSALHKYAYETSKLVEYAKEKLTALHNLSGFEVVFTSGATESANLALKGTIDRFEDIKKTHVITTTIEHACVTQSALYLMQKGASVSFVHVEKNGKLSTEKLISEITPHTKIISIIWVNNETGIIQDIKEICEEVKKTDPSIIFHIDATQGFGKIPQDLSFADLISVSAHKFHGPKGIGALFVKKGVNLTPEINGGGQQNNLRSGTINVPLIAALGKTCELTDPMAVNEKLVLLQKYLYKKLTEVFGEACINSRIYEEKYVAHIISVSFPGLKGEVLLHMLEDSDIYVSTSSACSAHNKQKTVLEHLGFDKEKITGTIRISISEFTTEEEMDFLVKKLNEAVTLLKSLRR